MPIIGVARHGDLASLRDLARRSLEAQGILDPAILARLQGQLRFIPGADDDPDTFRRLRAELGPAEHPLHYLAIPPVLFAEVIRLLGASHCADGWQPTPSISPGNLQGGPGGQARLIPRDFAPFSRAD